MVFSSAVFLFLFLPVVLIGHCLIGKNLRNVFLLVASLFFYAWGEVAYVAIMVLSILFNYFFGLILNSQHLSQQVFKRKLAISAMVVANLLPLFYFKYSVFLIENIFIFLNINQAGISNDIHLPIGISFFTFQAISYLVDVYRKNAQPQTSLIDLGLYISLFPQLIAGPIVRYNTIAEQLKNRIQTLTLFSSGVERFIFGLGKKMLIANPLGFIADSIFSMPPSELTMLTAWVGIICYTLQIYFDFSGYSDMAIGLGRMLGFRFLENFNYPYVSRSIREFWQRWHMSLSSWFRDYVYIPLGGNRLSSWRTISNLFIVFIICGLWHGASWNFLVWGLIHGSFLALERSHLGNFLRKLPSILQHVYVLLIVIIAWVFFRVETLTDSLQYLGLLFSTPDSLAVNSIISIQLDSEFYTILFIGILLVTPLYTKLSSFLQESVSSKQPPFKLDVILIFTKPCLLGLILCLCIIEIANGSYDPFIYFRF